MRAAGVACARPAGARLGASCPPPRQAPLAHMRTRTPTTTRTPHTHPTPHSLQTPHATHTHTLLQGVDFYFANRAHAVKFIDFMQSVVPIRYRHDKQLVHTSNYNYKYTFSVEIAPICRVSEARRAQLARSARGVGVRQGRRGRGVCVREWVGGGLEGAAAAAR